MTKELNMFVSDTNEAKSDSTKISSKNTAPKEGNSLFDNLMSNISEEVSDTNVSKESITPKNSSTTAINTAMQENKNPTEKKAEVSKNTPAVKSENTDTKTNEVSVNKIENKTLSLMDRMLLESSKKAEPVKETVSDKVQTPTTSEESAKTTNTKATVELTDNKNVPILKDGTEQSEKSKKSNTNKNTSTVEGTQDKKVSTGAEKSLFDSLISNVNTAPLEPGADEEPKGVPKVDKPILNTLKLSNTQDVKNQNPEDSDVVLKNINSSVKEDTGSESKEKVSSLKNEDVSQNIKSPIINDTIEHLESKILSKVAKTTEAQVKEKVSIPVKSEAELKSANISDDKVESIEKRLDPSLIKPEVSVASDNENIIKEEKNTEPKKSLMDQLLQESKNEIKIKGDTVTVEPKVTEKVDPEIKPLTSELKTESKSEKTLEVKMDVNNNILSSKTTENVVVKNDKVANELAKLNSAESNTEVNITKEQLNKLDTATLSEPNNKILKNEKSLLDRLVDESKTAIKNSDSETKPELVIKSDTVVKETALKNINPLMTNIYLSSQQKNINDAAIVKVATGKNMAANASNVKDVEKSADFLNLGLEDTEVTVKMQEFEKHSKLNVLDKLAFAKIMGKEELTKHSGDIVNKQTTATTSTVTTVSNTLVENETTVQMNVSTQAAASIESRIIGARQQVGSMMSEVARNMYLNYKPPVTAFKINLLPANLGSIAIVMKSDKESGLSISLNMSNNSTLESMIDNQSTLRAALAKNFSNEGNFSLDFNMQKQNDGNENSNQQNSSNNQETNSFGETSSASVTQGQNQEEINSSYM